MTRRLGYRFAPSFTLAVALAAAPAVAGTVDITNISGTWQNSTEPVPEPANLLLLGLALTAVAARMRRVRTSVETGA